MRHSDMYFCSGVQNSAPSTKTLYIESHLANNLHNLPYKLLERQKVVVERYVGLGCVLKCSMYTPCNRLECSLSKCQPRCLVYIIWFVSLGLFVWMTVNARHQIKLLRTYRHTMGASKYCCCPTPALMEWLEQKQPLCLRGSASEKQWVYKIAWLTKCCCVHIQTNTCAM